MTAETEVSVLSSALEDTQNLDWRNARHYRPDEPTDGAVLADLARQLAGLDRVDTPVWVFDAERCQALWANPAGLEIWKASTVRELQERNHNATQSEAVYALLNDYLCRVKDGEKIAVWVTLDSRGTTRRCYQSHHLVTLADNRHVLLVEAQAEPPAEEMFALASNYTLTIGLYAVSGRLVSGNPAFMELSEVELLSDLNDLLPPDTAFRQWPETLKEKDTLTFEKTLSTKRGKRTYRGDLRLVRTQRGRPQGLLTLYDLTEQRLVESEMALRESQSRMELLLDNARAGTFTWNLLDHSMHFDRYFSAMLGYGYQDLALTQAVWSLMIHREDSVRLKIKFNYSPEDGVRSLNGEFRIKAQSGEWQWVFAHAIVSKSSPTGRPVEAIGIALDIHERKRTEIALAESELRQRTLLGALPDLILIHDQHGTLIDRQTGRPQDWNLAADMSPTDAPPETIQLEVAARLREAQRTVFGTHKMVSGDYSVAEDEGIVRYREFSMVSLGQDQTLTVIRDVTPRALAEQERRDIVVQLQRTQRMDAIGQLTGGIAHDFNNILASILAHAMQAQDRDTVLSDPKVIRHLEVIVSAGERGRALVQKLRAFSRHAASTAPSLIDPLPVMREIAEMLESLIPARISFTADISSTLPQVKMDAIDLHQILVNLVLNSRDSIDQGGAITMKASLMPAFKGTCDACHRTVLGDYLAFVVQDNGGGITDAVLQQIFDPFFTTKDVGTGTGIGLAVVDGLTHRLGGHIVVDTALGQGTRLTILLPPGESVR